MENGENFYSFLPPSIFQPTGKWVTKSLAIQHKVLNTAQAFILAETLEICFHFCLCFICHKAKQTLYNLKCVPSVLKLYPPPLGIIQLSINEQTVFLGQNLLLPAVWCLQLSRCDSVCSAPADIHTEYIHRLISSRCSSLSPWTSPCSVYLFSNAPSLPRYTPPHAAFSSRPITSDPPVLK